MEQGFELTREWLEPNTFPDSIQLRKSQALKRQSTKVEATFHKADLNVSFRSKVSKGGIKQEACTNCGNCVTGCNYGAKNTTLMNYLPDAHTHGTTIFTEVAVRYIEKEGEKWRLRCRVYEDGKEPTDFSITCDVCIVAAGCLGSTEILLRSKEKGLGMSDMVGKKFTSNGDVMGFAYNGNAEVDGIGYPRNSQSMPI
jgi:cholesterol oxidase